MKALLEAITAIIEDQESDSQDRYDWEDIKYCLLNNIDAANSFGCMDTYSRELITDAAKADPEVKALATEHLGINWLF